MDDLEIFREKTLSQIKPFEMFQHELSRKGEKIAKFLNVSDCKVYWRNVSTQNFVMK